MTIKQNPRFPGNQPFQLTGTPNKTKKRSSMNIFNQKAWVGPKASK